MVYFVGAGCGAPDLITVRGQRLLREADVIVYAGSLVNPELLKDVKADAELHNSAFLDLEEILEIMIGAVREGRSVVRLHTGDPSVYGAIREQMDRLAEQGIPFEVCPGVSSFSGAAASLKAEYTPEERKRLATLMRRIEYDIDAGENVAALWRLDDEVGFPAEYMARFAVEIIVHQKAFLQNLVAFSSEGRRAFVDVVAEALNGER